MKTMTKVSVATLVVIGAVVAAIASGVFTRSASGGLDEFLGYVPVDSPLVLVGKTDQSNMDAADAMLRNLNPQDLEPLKELIEQSEQGSGARLLWWLLDDYVNTAASGGYDALSERYGLNATGPYGFYVHGAAPVMRLSLNSPVAMKAVLAEAEAETGVSARETMLGSATVYAWNVSEEKPEMEVALALDETSLTLSVFSGTDTDSARMMRFARQPATEPLAGSERLKELRAEYAEADQFMGIIDIHRIVEAFLLPQQSSTGRELNQWFPQMEENVGKDLTDACRRDVVSLAGSAPRITMGAEEYDVTSKMIKQSLGFLWEIDNQKVVSSLQKMQGHVPGYAYESDDKLAAFAMGLNVSQMVPAMTELWTQFTQASFECEQLQQAQKQAQSYNPAMLAMGTAMVDSVRGAGLALFNLEPSDETPVGLDGSLLVSISSENPASLASMMTSFLPQFSGLQVPTDGSAVEIPNPMGLKGNFIAIKGKHLVLYRGEAGKAAADELAGETLDANGLSALALNLSEPQEMLDLMKPLAANAQGGGCLGMHVGLLSLAQMPIAMTYQESLTSAGWRGGLDLQMEVVAPPKVSDIAGTYELSMLDGSDCQWHSLGTETLDADGSGLFEGQGNGADCADYQSKYTWSLTGSLMTQSTSVERERSSCDGEWETLSTAEDFDCGVLSQDDKGFYCLVQNSDMTELELYRYQAL